MRQWRRIGGDCGVTERHGTYGRPSARQPSSPADAPLLGVERVTAVDDPRLRTTTTPGRVAGSSLAVKLPPLGQQCSTTSASRAASTAESA